MILIPKPVDNLSQSALARFLTLARRAVRVSGQVNVLLTDNAAMRELNRRFRKQNQPTDVLSFPSEAGVAAKFAGELAISFEIAAENAERLGHTLSAEVKTLILHGLLHLAGLDHECDNGEMARKEAKLRRELKLPVALIERASAASQASPARKVVARRVRS